MICAIWRGPAHAWWPQSRLEHALRVALAHARGPAWVRCVGQGCDGGWALCGGWLPGVTGCCCHGVLELPPCVAMMMSATVCGGLPMALPTARQGAVVACLRKPVADSLSSSPLVIAAARESAYGALPRPWPSESERGGHPRPSPHAPAPTHAQTLIGGHRVCVRVCARAHRPLAAGVEGATAGAVERAPCRAL